jgi:hypothetical protein
MMSLSRPNDIIYSTISAIMEQNAITSVKYHNELTINLGD